MSDPVRGAKVIQVVEVVSVRGEGTPDDVVREVKQYWSLEGKFLADVDTWNETKGEGKDMTYRVYDNRTNKTLYTNKDKLTCANFISATYDESDDDFEHMSIGEVKS